MTQNDFFGTVSDRERGLEMSAALPVLMRKVYSWMTLALVITGFTAWGVANSPALLQVIYGSKFALIALVVAWFLTRNLERVYSTETTIYTGMITGYNIEGGSGSFGGNPQTNIQNLLHIITTHATVHEVSLRLFARCMMYGDRNRNTNYITAEHYNELLKTVPIEVKNLINDKSEEITFRNLKGYEKGFSTNYLFGLLNNHQYFGIENISAHLKPHQIPGTDIQARGLTPDTYPLS